MSFIITQDGYKVYFDKVLELMNDSLLSQLDDKFIHLSPQEFYDLYCEAHLHKFYVPFDILDIIGIGDSKELLISIIKEQQNGFAMSTI